MARARKLNAERLFGIPLSPGIPDKSSRRASLVWLLLYPLMSETDIFLGPLKESSMVFSWWPRGLRGPAGGAPHEAPSRGSPVGVELARRVPPAACRRRSSTIPAIDVAVSQTSDDTVIRVKGEAGVGTAGALLDGLLASAACRSAVVTLDLSELRSISSLAMGVLAAYRRGVLRAGGRVRLAEGLQPAVKAALARAELLELFETSAGAWDRQAGATSRHSGRPATVRKV
jgi:anti-anti-sigma factor